MRRGIRAPPCVPRLAAPDSGSSPAAWTETFSYDGFGNLTAKVLNGVTVASVPVNAATNQLTGALYDGNVTSGLGRMTRRTD